MRLSSESLLAGKGQRDGREERGLRSLVPCCIDTQDVELAVRMGRSTKHPAPFGKVCYAELGLVTGPCGPTTNNPNVSVSALFSYGIALFSVTQQTAGCTALTIFKRGMEHTCIRRFRASWRVSQAVCGCVKCSREDGKRRIS